MRKFINKALGSITVASMLTYYACPVFAYLNEETIYSNLDSNGKAYQSTVTTVVEDKNGSKTTQDTTKEELPIETRITYFLNDEEIDSDKIAGKKGRVTIKLEFENKEKNTVKINENEEEMYTPFVVVAGLMIDNKANTDIKIKNGKLLTNGNSSIAVGMALPGMQESLDIDEDIFKIPSSIEISMDTERFESGNIMVYASPKLLGELDIKMKDFDEIFNQINALDTASKALEKGAFTLTDGIKTLDAGAVKLDNGISSLDNGIDSLKSGVSELNTGATTLKNGTAEFSVSSQVFNSGVAQISGGVSTLNAQYADLDVGINTLNSKSSELQAGASQLKDGAISINTGVTTLKDGAGELDSGTEKVLTGINTVVDGLAPKMTEEAKNEKKNALDEIIEYNESALGDNVTFTIQDLQGKVTTYTNSLNQIPSSEELQAGLAAELLTEEQVMNYEQTRELLSGLITSLNTNIQLLTLTQGNYTALTQTKASISETIDDTANLYNGLLQIQAGMQGVSAGVSSLSGGLTELSVGTNSLVSGTNQLSDGTVALTAGTVDLANGSSQVVNGLATLDAGATSLAENSQKLTSASTTIANGAASLQSGTVSLQTGVNTLSNGSKELKNGSLSLTEGTLALVTGAETLSNGIKQFNSEGIDKIVDLANNNGKDFIRRIEKLEELSNDYKKFASKEERDDLKFIAITDSIKANSETTSSKSDKNSKSKK